MTLPPVVRIFFAVDLPAPTKKLLGSYISSLKKQAKNQLIRWSLPENLHITLQFLAEVKSSDLGNLTESVRTALQDMTLSLTISFKQLQLFPTPYRPRVIVLEVKEQEALAVLAETIGASIILHDYTIDARPFRGHLTLGRIKQPQHADLSFLQQSSPPTLQEILVEEVVLFRSEPQQFGSHYTILERIPFQAKQILCGNTFK